MKIYLNFDFKSRHSVDIFVQNICGEFKKLVDLIFEFLKNVTLSLHYEVKLIFALFSIFNCW